MTDGGNLACNVSYAVPRAGVPAAVSFSRWVVAALAAEKHAGETGQGKRFTFPDLQRHDLIAAESGEARRNRPDALLVPGPLLAIRLVDAREGRELNRDFRLLDYATNVLSFPGQLLAPVAGSHRWLGDIALCAPVISREARAQRKRTRDHYAHLTVHGVLHLLGFDHERAVDARAMERIERRVLAGFGIADPYA